MVACLGGTTSTLGRGLELRESRKGVTTLGNLPGDIDDRVSSGLVPGTPRTLKMSPETVRYWLSSTGAWFGTHKQNGEE